MEMASSSFILGSDFKCMFSSRNTKTMSGFGALRHPHPNGLFSKCFHFHTLSTRTVSGTTKMVSDVYVGGVTSFRVNSKMYTKLDSCLVIPPTPNRAKPRAIVKFLGGAFIGAVPEVTYGYLTELLAKEGFLVVVVPYNVTFDHSQAAKQVYERFQACLGTILTSGLPQANLSPAQLEDLPLFSIGHSNGALLQVLTGSLFSEKIPKANAIIAYNNRPATEAVPYFEQLGPAVSQMMPVVEATPFYSIARNASGDVWKMMLDAVRSTLQETEQEILNSLTKFVDQLPSVMNEVTQGVSEFKPTPSENRDCFKCLYNVEHTLLVKFNSDAIDETDILEETLKLRVESLGGTLEKVTLSGNHITPCIQEPRWQVGKLYTPADAVAQGLKSLSLNDTKILARTISDWFRRFEG
ncbi:hypothetical protein AAZX31_17G206900 [Glycine max]|uniref:DUF1350 domain-containing protein n=2 Tax=Glycine subgen. Soja TaxID=1462606 RepID=K7MNA8_SOYBN|nr:uncharacterized protein LOC100799131 isoform X1 [Glycine max]XP_028208246.1 uncharacterized protein LOC114391434 isoform X1 [Glycine soja]KAG4931401.1 hypothetical protein JHK86_048362 [Glycine max]KAG4934146.1 hypothetical protein JHK87_048148 [Glycine soja]KAG5098656.1 hypothetical protein JHK82_048510 [Glycine max]KAH1119568.1 hypothetical protein GYH30_048094 [Glycine max]KHN37111.1 hypothetical protein glysoja_009139 [Glycine soja]|eukprot:XP_003550228.1 uncharacterized protein LOC100799131 isoform X1 [Glycine max]